MENRLRFIAIYSIFISVLFARTGDLFNSIESQLSKYRYNINKEDISFTNGIIRLELDSRRTNIKSQQLLGFYSVGSVLNKTKTPFREVQIIINYELREGQEVITTAPVELILKLSQGKLSSEQFFDKLGI